MRLLYPREKERRNSFRKVSVLTGDRMSDSFLQRFHTMPFILRPDPTIAADFQRLGGDPSRLVQAWELDPEA